MIEHIVIYIHLMAVNTRPAPAENDLIHCGTGGDRVELQLIDVKHLVNFDGWVRLVLFPAFWAPEGVFHQASSVSSKELKG